MAFFLSLSGYHNAGKTTLGTFLVSELKKKNYKIAVIKSCKLTEDIIDNNPAKDTWKYKALGIEKVILFQKEFFTLFQKNSIQDQKLLYHFFLSFFWKEDFVLFEGFKNFSLISKIWIVKDEKEADEILKIKSQLRNLIGFVVKKKETINWLEDNFKYKAFLWEEKEKLLNFVEQEIEKHKEKVLLFVNDKLIPMNHFVADVLKYPILGFLKTLKNVPENINFVEIKLKLS